MDNTSFTELVLIASAIGAGLVSGVALVFWYTNPKRMDRSRQKRFEQGSFPAERQTILTQATALLTEPMTADRLEKVAAILKSLSDIRAQESLNESQQRTLRLEGWKSLATVVVPLLTLITLAVTIWIQNSQIQAMREGNEDKQWREALKSFSVKHFDPLADLTADAALKSFYTSPRYRDQAYAMTKIMLGHMTDEEGFRDLYSSAYVYAAWNNIADIADIDRGIRRTFFELDDMLQQATNSAATPPAGATPPSPFPLTVPPAIPFNQVGSASPPFRPGMAGPYGHWPREYIEHARSESIGELQFLTNEICGTLKQPRPPEWHDFTLDLSSTFLIDGDCANADFSDTDLSSARFERMKLDGARLNPTAFAASDWVQTLWWNAGQINQQLLVYLKNNYYLGHDKDEFSKNYDGPAPAGVDFKKRLDAHCRSVGLTCN